jgi:hypothetical protein
MQQVALKIEEQKLQQTQASAPQPTASLIEQLTQLAAQRKQPANSSELPVSAEIQQFQPIFPSPSPEKFNSNTNS